MSYNLDGTANCDRCGLSAGHGGVVDALILSDLNFDTGATVNYHFCRSVGRLNNDGIRCCDAALSPIAAASLYDHVGPTTDNGVGGGGGGGSGGGAGELIIRAF